MRKIHPQLTVQFILIQIDSRFENGGQLLRITAVKIIVLTAADNC